MPMSSVNIHRPVFDERREYEGFSCLRARLGRQAGTEKLGLSLFEVPPGEAAYPYHWHLAEEEVLIVLGAARRCESPKGGASSKPATSSRFRSVSAAHISL